MEKLPQVNVWKNEQWVDIETLSDAEKEDVKSSSRRSIT